MKRIAFSLLLGAIVLIASLSPAIARAGEGEGETGRLTVPWDEFKRLLNLDEDEIVLPLETFHRLVAQIDPDAVPQHAIQGGRVVLTHAAFQALVDRMKSPVQTGAKPPFDHLMTKAIYSGKMGRQDTRFTGTFHVHVLSENIYLKVPILPQTVALEDVTVSGKQALIVSESGYHHVILSASGEHVINAKFSLRSSIEQGPQKVDMQIQQTPITLFRLDIPLKGIDVEIPQAQQIVTTPSGERTLVSAIITPGRGISVRWRDKVAVADKVPPKLYGEVFHLVSIEDDVLKITSDVNYNILHSEIDRVRLSVAPGLNVLSVEGEGVGEWQEIGEGEQREILVPFTYGRKGNVTIRVVAETPLSETAAASTFTGFRVLDTVRETGFLGIEVRTSAEVTVTESEGLEPIAVQKLPQTLHSRAVKPLMHGFKYLKHPYSIALTIQKHDKIAVPVATIRSASAVTLFTEDGKIVHRLVYQVVNSAKQFLEIGIPAESDIWSVFVDNKPVESAINSEGQLLVPLIRSRTMNDQLSSFPVEIVYASVEERFSSTGGREAMLPPVDLLTSQLIWSVYLPSDYAYLQFSSTLEKEEMIRGLNLLARTPREYDEGAMKQALHLRGGGSDVDMADRLQDAYKGKESKSRFRNAPVGEEEVTRQMQAEIAFSSRLEGLAQEPSQTYISGAVSGTGVLPIQIQIPTGGQVYRFARTIIREEDPLTMSVTYSAKWVITLLKWVILVLVLLILFIGRRILGRAVRGIGGKTGGLHDAMGRHEGAMKRISQSIITPIVLFGLVIVLWSFSGTLTALCLFLFWVSLIYQFIRWRRRNAREKSGGPGAPTGGGS